MAAFRRVIRLGLLGGVGLVYVALVGMVEAFSDIDLVEDVLPLGTLLMAIPPFLVGTLGARPVLVAGEGVSPDARAAITGGALSGVIAGAMAAAVLLVVDAIGVEAVREVFQSMTEQLVSIMTFDRDLPAGATLLVLMCAVSSALGSSIAVLPRRIGSPVVVGLTFTIAVAMLQDVVRVAMAELRLETDWLFSPRFGGLTYLGVAATLLIGAVAQIAWAASASFRRSRAPAAPGVAAPTRILVGLAIGVALVLLPIVLGSFLSAVLGRVGLFILLGLGLNIVVGYAGLLDLGYVAFFAVGAYSMAVLTAAENSGSSIFLGLSFFEALPFVLVFAVLAGLLVGGPVLRLRGDYLAIVTLGFGEIARVLVKSDWLSSFLGGAQGLIGIPAPELAIGGLDVSFRQPQPFYYFVLAFCLFATFVSWRLANSRIGRAWTAMREDEQVAEATGVSTIKYKLLAFGAGAAIGSLAGALFAVQIGSLAPTSFDILISIQALAILILGGLGSIPGVVVGALVLVGLPGFLTEFEQFESLIYGAALVTIMLYRPQGLVPNVRRTRELQEEDRAQDAWLQEHEDEAVPAGREGAS